MKEREEPTRPYYDPQLATLKKVESLLTALPKGLLKFGEAIILPNTDTENSDSSASWIVMQKKSS